MTLQVGMVGTDGIVLASDTKWMNTAGIRHSSSSSKITVDPGRGIAVACARNLELSVPIAKAIIDAAREGDFEHPLVAMERIGTQMVSLSSQERRDAQCLIVFVRPSPKLYYLQTDRTAAVCKEEWGKVVAGDQTGAAVFFTERYYERKPVRALLPLAAQLIFEGHKLNDNWIQGLEILVCDDAGFHSVPKESIAELQSRAAALDAAIESSLFQEFNYTPDTAT